MDDLAGTGLSTTVDTTVDILHSAGGDTPTQYGLNGGAAIACGAILLDEHDEAVRVDGLRNIEFASGPSMGCAGRALSTTTGMPRGADLRAARGEGHAIHPRHVRRAG